MVFSLHQLLFRARRDGKQHHIDQQLLNIERVDARELKRMKDELRLVREKARLYDVILRNRIF